MSRSERVVGGNAPSNSDNPQERSFENLMAFVKDPRATSVPIGRKEYTPPLVQTTPKNWIRRFEILGTYLGTDKTLEQLGDKHRNVTREYIRQVVKKGVEQLHQVQSPRVKSKHPLESFDYRKPWSLESKRRRSKFMGGRSVKIEEAIRQGKTLDQLKRRFNTNEIAQARLVLRKWGTEVPYRLHPILPRFEKLKDPELSDEEKQKLLDKIDHHGIISVLSSGDDPYITNVSTVGREAGLFFRLDKVELIYDALKARGVIVSVCSERIHRKGREYSYNHYLICANDKEKAKGVIQDAIELNQFRANPVKVLGKAENQIPRVWELVARRKFSSIMPLIAEIRGRAIGPRSTTLKDLFSDDCPASIYNVKKGGWYYEIKQEKDLKAYLIKRLKELGLM